MCVCVIQLHILFRICKSYGVSACSFPQVHIVDFVFPPDVQYDICNDSVNPPNIAP